MPRSVCPYCEHESSVPERLVGHVDACPQCTRPSMVIDVDAEQIKKLKRETSIGTATSTSLPNMWIVKVVLAVGALVALLPSFLLLLTGNITAILTAVMTLGSVIVAGAVASVMLEAMDEVHRCRRLLEEVVRKRD